MTTATATSRLFSLVRTSNLLYGGAASTATATKLYQFAAIRFAAKSFPSRTLRFSRYTSSSSAPASVVDDDSVATTTAISSETPENSQQKHPWPEWVTFVDRLKSKGYLIRGDQNEGENEVFVYNDMSILKDACLSFARDRFDIFKSLSREDIQTVVEKGCPNIHRKTVNSGKRLRAYLQLREEDVCGNCILRGTCDRAYLILKEFEAAPRTVDIVRILLNYALDPVVTSIKKPSGTELVEVSARKLLSELTDLSDTTVDPHLPKPAATVAPKERSIDYLGRDSSQNVEMKRGDWMCPMCNFMNFSRNKKCRECNEDGPLEVGGDYIEMKTGDWICPQCEFLNFARNIRCLKCKTEVPKRVGMDNVEMKKGDWNCPKCEYLNFARNIRCLKCKTEVPKMVGMDNVEMKKGDWNCPKCQYMNFASNTKCLRCREQRPKRQLRPGDWECPSCDFLNFSGNVICRKCNHEGLKDVQTKHEEQIWKRPF